MDNFNNRLKQAMEYRNVKPAELSKITNIGKSSISQWLSGKYSAKQDKIFVIAKALNVNPSWLIGANVPMSNETLPDKIFNLSSKLDEKRQNNVYNYTEQQYNEQNNIIQMPLKSDVKLYGAVSAGTGEYLLDNEPELVPYEGVVPEHDYAVIVNGVSMRPLFEDKQIIFVKKTFEARSGQVVIAYYDNQAYVKKYVNDEKGARFVSLNKSYDDMPIDETHEAEIIGVVVL
ncbi:MAG: XRE family transcriptional regulator [Leuconostoc pseudomesenteroides]|uniref:LexA family transcriptional regulator n=1 Tax=Leuconostoc pseudomesenteroides TaxID=33968 RepID=A0A5B8SWC3_LEUPS|nr:XRE family transcriptional regulator [Leuconostoc pseudomesenteroides]QEA41249.1 LexA family transcriptional regulator [Leuconostoc pseudomesenteroides]